MQQQSRRRLPSLHAIGRSRCVDLEDTPSEPACAWLPPPPSSDHEVDKVDEDEESVIPSTRYASKDYTSSSFIAGHFTLQKCVRACFFGWGGVGAGEATVVARSLTCVD